MDNSLQTGSASSEEQPLPPLQNGEEPFSDLSPEAAVRLNQIWNSAAVTAAEPSSSRAHRDRIQKIIDETSDWHELQRILKEEVASFEVEIPKIDKLPGIEAYRETSDMMKAQWAAEDELNKPEPFYGNTVIEINVPSGFLVIRDSLAPLLAPTAVGSMRRGLETHQMALNYAADHNVASASVGNSDPAIVQKDDGSYLVVSPEYSEEKGGYVYKDDETRIFSVDTGSWSVEISDYQNWLDQGGEILDLDGEDILAVEPGRYRWVAQCHRSDWYYGSFCRAEFATLTLIDPTDSEGI